MKTVFVLLLAAIALPATGRESVPLSFEQRLVLAQAAEEDESVHPYPEQVVRNAGRDLARAMRRCWSPAGKQVKPFVLVADIDAAGRPHDVEVKPSHAASRCFAAGFASITYLPAPPFAGREVFPVRMRVAGGR
ncbi:MAG TPA: hypothetical protein VEC35_13860 [Noviherbaspirillum sp.]|nr:hypothetical protein [Noviherbaspirillum sp.]